MSRTKWVAIEPQRVVESANYRKQANLKRRGTRENAVSDAHWLAEKKNWQFVPPDFIHLSLKRDCGVVPSGLVISICQPIGALLLYRKVARIHASPDVNPDAVITGEYEEIIAQMELGSQS